jgi:hypothetical protein
VSAQIINLAERRRYLVVRRERRPTAMADVFLLPIVSVALCMEMATATLETAARLATLPLWPGGSDHPGL